MPRRNEILDFFEDHSDCKIEREEMKCYEGTVVIFLRCEAHDDDLMIDAWRPPVRPGIAG